MITVEQLLEQSYIPVVRTVIQPRLKENGELLVRYGLNNVYVPADQVIPMMHHHGSVYLGAKLVKTGHSLGHNRVPITVMAVKQDDDGSIITVDTEDNGFPEVHIAFEWKDGKAFVLKSTLEELLVEQTQLRR